MSSTQSYVGGESLGTPPSVTDVRRPRVRHQARDAVALMTFSAMTSLGLASCLMLLSGLGR
jgi:hypothetical protein